MNIIDPVILTVDLPDEGLHKGDVGAIVEVLDDDVYEVEFLTPAGKLYALVTLKGEQLASRYDAE